jgi:hypothetical protein
MDMLFGARICRELWMCLFRLQAGTGDEISSASDRHISDIGKDIA